jgi:alpha-tubulin suppressor-like RCC1 family protein
VSATTRRTHDVAGSCSAGTCNYPFTDTLCPAGCFAGACSETPQQTYVSAGANHTCALDVTGALDCWGWNNYGQLGDGTTQDSSKPVLVQGLPAKAIAYSAGSYHTCAILADSTTWCWGNNSGGQLGDGTTTNHLLPVRVQGIAGTPVAISCGSGHTCIINSEGALECWGDNVYGALGDGTKTNRSTPLTVPGWSSGTLGVSAGNAYTCAINSSGALYCFGSNYLGDLGDGTQTYVSAPVAVVGLSSNVSSVSAGTSHTCAVVGGVVECWGDNWWEDLGNGPGLQQTTPKAVANVGVSTSVGAGYAHSCALALNGSIQCWGFGNSGAVGDGLAEYNSLPAQVIGLTEPQVQLAVGLSHTCSASKLGTVRCWGYNQQGQIGDGTTKDALTPVAPVGF